jgi:hypothetical protein
MGGVTITDDNPNAESAQGCAGNLLCFTIGSSFHTTIAGIKFLPGTATGDYIMINGTGLAPLMHDMDFNIPNFQLGHAVQWDVTGGVIWNTTFESTQDISGSCGQQVGSDSGSLVVKPNINWDNASTMGTLDTNGTQNLYIEDSTFSYVGQMPDVDDNGRVVMRHVQIINSSGLTHGTTSTYGGRHVEIYDSTLSYTNPNRNISRYFWLRGGTLLMTGNNIQWINGGCYPDKPSVTVTVENAQRADGGHGCCTGRMCFHQSGSGANGVGGLSNLSSGQIPIDAFQISDPVYIWGNTGTGQGSSHYGINEGQPLQCSGAFSTADFYVAGRDYFYDDSGNPASGAKPGWARYSYPHPLRGTFSSGVPAPPTNLAASVQ